MSSEPMVTRMRLCSLQVCVPKDYTDEQVEEFANRDSPTGIKSDWRIRKQGDPMLDGDAERVPCGDESRKDCCHIMLDC